MVVWEVRGTNEAMIRRGNEQLKYTGDNETTYLEQMNMNLYLALSCVKSTLFG